MAKIDGQEIPSELYAVYIRTMARASSNGRVCKRYPFALPHMRSGSPRVSPAAQAQRERFRAAVQKFAAMPEAQRERYYAAAPEWNSVLWYYNYAIMSALAGNANADAGGYGVIKSIQNVSGFISASGVTALPIAAIDNTKCVVMLYGASYISDKIQRGAGTVTSGESANIAISAVDPALCTVNVRGSDLIIDITSDGYGGGRESVAFASALSATQLTVRASTGYSVSQVPFSWEVVEHRAQTVYPIVDTIEANAVKLRWSLEPSQGAEVSALVIEYI